jgi:hypothetical protein
MRAALIHDGREPRGHLASELIQVCEGWQESVLNCILGVSDVAQKAQNDLTKASQVADDNVGELLNFVLVRLDRNSLSMDI